jgi:hypothetical protein
MVGQDFHGLEGSLISYDCYHIIQKHLFGDVFLSSSIQNPNKIFILPCYHGIIPDREENMKSLLKVSVLAILSIMLGLSACTSQTATPTLDPAALVYTSAAQTAAVQLTHISNTITAQPSATQTLTPTNTATIFPTATPFGSRVSTATTSGCDQAAFVADVTFPDNTVVAPDTAFGKTWSFQNSGTCTWNANYSLTFISGSAMSGTTVSLGKTVAPGATVAITVPMVSPHNDGAYTGYWRMMNSNGVRFGVAVYVLIKVSSSVTSTPTRTVTPTSTITSGHTATPTSTTGFTSTPSFTFTPTATATNTPLPTSTSTVEPTATETPTY